MRSVQPTSSGPESWPRWRIAAVSFGALVLLVVGLLGTTVLGRAVSAITGIPEPVGELLGLPVVLGLYAGYARYAIGRPLVFFGVVPITRASGRWLLGGLLLPGLVVAIGIVSGSLAWVPPHPRGVDPVGAVASTIALAVVIAVLEEFVFRGYLFRLWEVRWNARVAVGGTAVVFALLHNGQAASSIELVFVSLTTILAGVLLALVVYRTRNLWNAVAVHVAWNVVFAGRIVGVGVAPDPPPPAIVQFQAVGNWFAPAGVPPSAGPAAAAVLALAIVVVLASETIAGVALVWRR